MKESIRHLKRTMVSAAVLSALAPAQAQSVSWIQAAGGLWQDAANWSPQAPDAASDIDISGGPFQVEYRGFQWVTDSFASARIQDATLLVTQGTLALGKLTQAGAGSVTIAGGALTVGDGSSFDRLRQLDGNGYNTLNIGSGAVVARDVEWQTAHLQGVQTGQGLTVTGNAFINGGNDQRIEGANLYLNGQTQWSAGNATYYVGWGGSLNIGQGATFTDAGATAAGETKRLNYSYAQEKFRNAGTYVREGAGTTEIWLRTTNSGLVHVKEGTLDFHDGGSSTGSFVVDANARLRFSGSESFAITAGKITSAGVVDIASNFSLAAGTSIDTPTLVVSAGQLKAASGSLIKTNALSLTSGGSLYYGSPLSVQTLTMDGGQLHNTQLVTAGNLVWKQSGFAATSTPGGTGNKRTNVTGDAALSGSDTLYLFSDYTLELQGRTTWEAGYGQLYAADTTPTRIPVLRIGSQGSFTDLGALNAAGVRPLLSSSTSTGRLENAGTFTRLGLGTTEVGVLKNTGTVDIQAGTLRLAGGGNNTGRIHVAAGGRLELSKAYDFAGGVLENDGAIQISGTQWSIGQATGYRGNGSIGVQGVLTVESGIALGTRGVSVVGRDSGGSIPIDGGHSSVHVLGSIDTQSLSLDYGTVDGPGTVTAGSLNLKQANFGRYDQAGGLTAVSGAAFIDGTRRQSIGEGYELRLDGVTTWSTGTETLFVTASAQRGVGVLHVGAGGTFLDKGGSGGTDRYLGHYAHYLSSTFDYSGTILNDGKYVKQGSGTTGVGAVFRNNGTLQVDAGTLRLVGGGSSDGNVTIAADATLQSIRQEFSVQGGLRNDGTLLVGGLLNGYDAPPGRLILGEDVSYAGNGNIVVSNTGSELRSLAQGEIAVKQLSVSAGTASFAGVVRGDQLVLREDGAFVSGSTASFDRLDVSGGRVGSSNATGHVSVRSAAIDGRANLDIRGATTLQIDQQATWSAGDGRIDTSFTDSSVPPMPGATLQIAAGATFTDAGAASAAGIKQMGGRAGTSAQWPYGPAFFDISDGLVANKGVYRREGLGTTFFGARFENAGTFDLLSGTASFANGLHNTGVVNVAAGATLQLTAVSGARHGHSVDGGRIDSAGTIDVDSGALRLVNGGRIDGTAIRVRSGLLDAGAGTNVTADSIELQRTGPGRPELGFDGVVSAELLRLHDGVAHGSGSLNVRELEWNGGAIGGRVEAGGGRAVVRETATLSGDSNLQVTDGVTLELHGNTTWSAGSGGLAVYGYATAPTRLQIAAGAVFADAGAGLAAGAKSLSGDAGGSVVNEGTYLRDGLGTTLIGARFDNAGLFDLRSGTASFAGGLNNTGLVRVAAGSTLALGSAPGGFSTHDIDGGRIDNAGSIGIDNAAVMLVNGGRIEGGTVHMVSGLLGVGPDASVTVERIDLLAGTTGTKARLAFDGAVSAALLHVSGGTAYGSGSLDVQRLEWDGGSIGGRTTVHAGAVLSGSKDLQVTGGHALELRGDTSWSAGDGSIGVTGTADTPTRLLIAAGTSFNDAGGVKRLQGDAGGSIVNDGTYVRSGLGSTDTRNFINNGRLEVREGSFVAGTGFANRGTVDVSAGATLVGAFVNEGRLQGRGRVATGPDGTLANEGRIDPGAAGEIGQLSVDGNLALGEQSELHIDVDAAGGNDLISVSGSFAAGGRLVLRGLAGFVPAIGDEFSFLTYGQLASGTSFTSVTWEGSLLPEARLDVVYGPSDIRLRVTAAVPEPSTYVLTAFGLLAGMLVARRRRAGA